MCGSLSAFLSFIAMTVLHAANIKVNCKTTSKNITQTISINVIVT